MLFRSVTSSAATLTVLVSPTITTQPVGVTVALGGTINLSVIASGSPTLSYQWFKGSTLIAGATSASLAISPATAGDAGSYTVKVSNGAGSVTSSAAVVQLLGAPTITAILYYGTAAEVQFNSSTGVLYTLESKNSLSDTTWTPVPGAEHVPGVGGAMSVYDINASTPTRFYRLRAE